MDLAGQYRPRQRVVERHKRNRRLLISAFDHPLTQVVLTDSLQPHLLWNLTTHIRVKTPVKKVLVIGSPGAGKSVFSRRLGEITGLPVIHLDQEFWQPGWVETPKDLWRLKVEELLKRDSWIIDGNYSGTMDLRLEYCDTAIFLDFPRQLCTWRVFKRFLLHRGGRVRPDMAPGCTEKINVEFLKWTWTYPTRSRVGVVRRLERVREEIFIVRLTTNREVENFLFSCGSKTESENGNRELRDQYR